MKSKHYISAEFYPVPYISSAFFAEQIRYGGILILSKHISLFWDIIRILTTWNFMETSHRWEICSLYLGVAFCFVAMVCAQSVPCEDPSYLFQCGRLYSQLSYNYSNLLTHMNREKFRVWSGFCRPCYKSTRCISRKGSIMNKRKIYDSTKPILLLLV
jgi:hypothetical protein